MEHYENFPVASFLCPPDLRAPIMAIYRFARTVDDIADEGGAVVEQRLQDLADIRQTLTQCSEQSPTFLRWPEIFKPLHQEIQRRDLPIHLLHHLLDAFEQDVRYTHAGRRYNNRQELLNYCERSANPIGRLLLHLYKISDASALQESDCICTALQLINFWQDLSVDIPRGRFYLPLDSNLKNEIEFANQLMQQGQTLVHRVKGCAGWELRAVVQGGLRIIDKIHFIDTHIMRPTLKTWDWPVLIWRCCLMKS
ncbi:MAG: squalene synthase HpnC [Limnohabitans sp.]|nr:squalene synthase HpnC [Limnohabitans sp.]